MGTASPASGKIPLWLKVLYTAFVCVLVPFYWTTYGPTNFLYFCDVAVFLTLATMWTEHPLPASMAAVGILVPQTVWVIDFLAGLAGVRVLGMTAYMFNKDIWWFARGLSLFHGWLPFLLVYLVYRLGYDRRGFVLWTVLSWVLLLVCYFLMPAPPAPAGSNVPVNINYVYGTSDEHAQTWMPPLAWFLFLMAALPLLFYLPVHLLLSKTAVRAKTALTPS